MTHSFVCWRLDGSKRRRFRLPPKAGDLMDELATAYGQKWFQDPKDVGNLRPENTTERIRKNFASMGTQEIR